MVKIVVEKNEAVADLIERILETEGEEITLVIPKKSHLLDSPNNFRLLAREAQVLEKNIVIESVDEKVLELAKEQGLASTHPLFDEHASDDGQRVSDIVPHSKQSAKPRRGRLASGDERAVPLKVHYAEEGELQDAPEEEAEVGGRGGEERYDTISNEIRSRKHFGMGKKILVTVVLAAVIWGGLWAFSAMFGKAEVSIRFKRVPWNFNEPVAALTSVKNVDVQKNVIPGQLFEEEKSLVESFPASGHANVSTKATGMITVVNAYSSTPQTLVARTRFQAPDGKIYRLDNQIVVPGAEVANGKITPSSIKAPVTADQAGPDYNVSAVPKLTIPGFKNTPRYDGFYGVLENGTSGGATGDHPVATDADIASAKAKITDTLKSAFQTSFLGSIPSDIKILDGASSITIGRMSIPRAAGSDGKFTVTGTAVFQAFGFREKDLDALLSAQASSTEAKADLIDTKLSYSAVNPNFIQKELKFSLSASANLVPDFNPNDFAGQISGQSKDSARNKILALPELEDAQISLWPSWLRSLPGNSKRVHITVQ